MTQPNGVEVPLATPARRLTSYRMVSRSLSDPPDSEQLIREESRTVYYKAPDKRLEVIQRRIGDEVTVYHQLRLGAMFWRWDPAGGPVVETDQVAQFGGLGPYEPALWPARMRNLEEVIYYNLSGQQIDGVADETVLGRPTWRFTVTSEKCNPRGYASSGGRQTVWIDQETLFPLRGELLRPDGNLIFKGETTELELDPVLPDSLFEYPKDRELLVTVNDPPWKVVSVTPWPNRTPSGCPIRDDANLRAVTAGGSSTLVPATPTP